MSLILDNDVSTETITKDVIYQRPRATSCLYKNIQVIKPLCDVKFPVYHVHCNDKNYAMKLFTNQEDPEGSFFANEISFSSLDHPNVVKTVYYEKNRRFHCQGMSLKASFILTEYAPHGDFYDFAENFSQHFNEKLIRTYFHQLIEGLEYLHSQNVAHLDIKLDNLLMGEDYTLKIADFDLSCSTLYPEILMKGTKCYRAPEMINGECKNGPAADIYSAGIFLFIMKSGQIVPHTEYKPFKGIDLLDLLNNNNPEFWRAHCRIQKKKASDFSEEFKELVNGMMKFTPEKRFTISEIKKSKWFNESIYSNEELKRVIIE